MTAFTELVGCELPLQLAGMGGYADVALAAAVSEAGGLGMLGAGGMPTPFLQPLLDAIPNATSKPFGINFLMPFLDRDAVALAAQRCKLVEFFYADPDASLVDVVHAGGALAGWQVGSGAEARVAAEAGCDIVVAQGNEAGGHVRGTKTLDEVLAEVLDAVAVPVVAAGGIGTAERVAEVLAAGASAVRVGTRFLAASESIAHPDYIAALIASGADDTEITEAFGTEWPNAPHRVLTASLRAAQQATDDPVATMSMGPMEVPVARFSSMWPQAGAKGNVAAMVMYAGTSVDAVEGVQPAAEIVAELCSKI